MTLTTLRAASSAPRVRAQTPGVDSDTALAHAHWCATRLVHHGWRFAHLDRDVLTALTPQGNPIGRGHAGGVAHLNLYDDLCAVLTAHGDRLAARLDVMLRLRAPISRRPDEIHPWTIPGSRLSASAGVRIGYWLATILSDDYRWKLLDFEAAEFRAVLADEDGPQRFTAAATPPSRGGRTPTTSMLLAAHLATLSDAERRTLTKLVTAHQRRLPCVNPDLPRLTGTTR
ncbi:MAG: hypothetical protein QG655_1237 [Actinomycetota bacterium]|nr:hypothetical protein [Actinomycetota bacterium]